jgi:4a-hydroxytetrahydrobiopterin dehydratase
MAKDTPLPEAEVASRLASLPDWTLRDGWIRRKFSTPGWPHTLMLVSAIGFRAEAAFHHPDLEVGWAQVVVKLQTHSAGGITEKDFALAQEIEALATWLPKEGGPLEGFPKKWVC